MASEVIPKTDEQFYSDAENYWSEIPATVDGMLGGFGFISLTDIKRSKMLLKQLFSSKCPPGREYALDCGAGIGRITKFLLADLFDKVDMVEQNSTFLDKAKQYLGTKKDKVHNFYATGLQDFQPEPNKYDVIWIQWVLGHLTNKDLLQFLENCKNGLKKNGLVVIKENITSSEDLELDRQDSSVTRSMKLYQNIFLKANLECYRLVKQHNFPKGLYSVYMFVLKPKPENSHKEGLQETANINIVNTRENEKNQSQNISDRIESTSKYNIEEECSKTLEKLDDNEHHVVDKLEDSENIEKIKISNTLRIQQIQDYSIQEQNKENLKTGDDVMMSLNENINCDT